MACFQTGLAGTSGEGDPVTRSLRFDTNGKLSRTFGTPNSKKTFTLAFWVKRAGFSSSAYKEIWQYNRSGRGGGMGFAPTQSNWMDEEEFQFSSRNANTGVADVNIALTTRFRDPAAWMHIALVVDTTLGSSEAADRIKIFVNNERNTNYDTSHTHSYYWPVQNYEFSEIFGGTGAPQNIGLRDTNNHPLNGYLADIYFIDGAAIEPDTNFIESTGYGSYKPKAFDMSSYSGNSFHIDAQPAHDADLLVSSIDRNDGDTLFADAAKGHVLTASGNTHHDNTVGNPFGSGTAMYFDGNGDTIVAAASSDFAFGTGDFTVEGWWYFESIPSSTDAMLVDFRPTNSTTTTSFAFSTDTTNGVKVYSGGNYVLGGSLSTNTWHHIALVRDSGTLYAYIDGTATGTTASFSSNLTANSTPRLGTTADGGLSAAFTGYIFDVRITKGTARYTSNFTAPSAPLELNPVYIGGDQSGNKNHFTPTNISMHDVMLDTPTKNYATINPLNGEDSSHAGYGEGNLHITYKNSGQATTFGATMAFPKTGKWYAEVYIKSYGSSDSTRPKIGICRSDYDLTKYNNDTGQLDSADCFHYQKGGNKGGNSAGSSSYGASHTTGDIIGVAFDSDNGTLTFYKNGASQGQAFSGLTKEYILATSGYDTSNSGTDDSVILNFGQDPTFAGNYTETPDSAEWAHSPPTGFKSLNSSNFDAPAVTPADHFNTVLYTGTRDNSSSLGATSNAVTGMGFEPSLLWIKDRDNRSNGYGSSYSGNYLFDSVQGTGKAINIDGNMYTGSNDFVSNLDGYNGVSSFDSDGFTLDEAEAVNYAVDSDWNGSIDTYERYAAWGWKLGSNGSSSTWASGNTDPTTEKYNASAGVSVIRRTETSGSGTGVTLNHSLGAAPEFAFLKDTVGNTQNVYVWHKDLDANKYLRFNATSAQTTGSGYFPSGCSTATTFQIGSDIAGVNGYDGWWDIYLYLFSGVESHSKFGTFEGNGLSDGPFIYTGFRPRFIMIKSIDDAYAWYIHDTARSPYNYSDNELVADTSGAEYSVSGAGGGERLDILSNGFKHRTSNSAMNQSSRTHIYAAFAESPFKYANAR